MCTSVINESKTQEQMGTWTHFRSGLEISFRHRESVELATYVEQQQLLRDLGIVSHTFGGRGEYLEYAKKEWTEIHQIEFLLGRRGGTLGGKVIEGT